MVLVCIHRLLFVSLLFLLYISYILSFLFASYKYRFELVAGGGFEPPKHYAPNLKSGPFDHTWESRIERSKGRQRPDLKPRIRLSEYEQQKRKTVCLCNLMKDRLIQTLSLANSFIRYTLAPKSLICGKRYTTF